MQHVTPIAQLISMSRNSKVGTLYQHPSIEKTIVSNFNQSTSQSANVPTSQSQTALGKKLELKSVLTKQAKPGDTLKMRKKSHEN